jgi:hypothetical protein
MYCVVWDEALLGFHVAEHALHMPIKIFPDVSLERRRARVAATTSGQHAIIVDAPARHRLPTALARRRQRCQEKPRRSERAFAAEPI